jgi:hypothetical protein
MNNKQTVIDKILQAFGANEYPGDGLLLGSREGCEPLDEVGPFVGRSDWQELEPDFLDDHYTALSFFSEAGFRFFLPAYLVADLQGQVETADPLFHLTQGFVDITVNIPIKGREFPVISGKTALLNPRRFGAMTWFDYARYRLSVFTREEAGAIVAYLQYRRDTAETDFEQKQINEALAAYWLERAQSAPTAAKLKHHLTLERERLAAMTE